MRFVSNYRRPTGSGQLAFDCHQSLVRRINSPPANAVESVFFQGRRRGYTLPGRRVYSVIRSWATPGAKG